MMTEREPDPELLAELLDKREPASPTTTRDAPILTRRDEQKLLDEANRIEPPTLAPADSRPKPARPRGAPGAISAASFGAEAVELARRHPIPALLLAAGLAYLLTRRRRGGGLGAGRSPTPKPPPLKESRPKSRG
jgi:hypothetical protein